MRCADVCGTRGEATPGETAFARHHREWRATSTEARYGANDIKSGENACVSARRAAEAASPARCRREPPRVARSPRHAPARVAGGPQTEIPASELRDSWVFHRAPPQPHRTRSTAPAGDQSDDPNVTDTLALHDGHRRVRSPACHASCPTPPQSGLGPGPAWPGRHSKAPRGMPARALPRSRAERWPSGVRPLASETDDGPSGLCAWQQEFGHRRGLPLPTRSGAVALRGRDGIFYDL